MKYANCHGQKTAFQLRLSLIRRNINKRRKYRQTGKEEFYGNPDDYFIKYLCKKHEDGSTVAGKAGNGRLCSG